MTANPSLGRLRSAAIASLAVLVACTGTAPQHGEPPQHFSTAQGALIGGTPTSAFPAVVALRWNGHPYCTGTLIGPKTVLTAAHCTFYKGPTGQYTAAVGPRASSPSKTAAIVRQIPHPDFSDRSSLGFNDIGLLELGTSLGVLPYQIDPAVLDGQREMDLPIHEVGYGFNTASQTGIGTKREGWAAMIGLWGTQIVTWAGGSLLCGGDSGGPGFASRHPDRVARIVGVATRGDCETTSRHERVDLHFDWLRKTAGTWDGTCQEDGLCVEGCSPSDVDCACMADGRCESNCPKLATDSDCHDGGGGTGGNGGSDDAGSDAGVDGGGGTGGNGGSDDAGSDAGVDGGGGTGGNSGSDDAGGDQSDSGDASGAGSAPGRPRSAESIRGGCSATGRNATGIELSGILALIFMAARRRDDGLHFRTNR